ncbi:MAG: hypothetical protein NTY38_10870 [Acidobacteria bacterium]|nr:hypothetical protein [Acidobacteriota bacterium]
MDYLLASCLSVIAIYVAFEGWSTLARSRSWRKSLNRLDKLEWSRVLAELRASNHQ